MNIETKLLSVKDHTDNVVSGVFFVRCGNSTSYLDTLYDKSCGIVDFDFSQINGLKELTLNQLETVYFELSDRLGTQMALRFH